MERHVASVVSIDPGTQNMGVAVVGLAPLGVARVLRTHAITLAGKKMSERLDDLASRLHTDLKYLVTPETSRHFVVIETQLPRATSYTISHVLYAIAKMRGLDVRFMSAASKFSSATCAAPDAGKKNEGKRKRAARNWVSKTFPGQVPSNATAKQQSDMSDAIMQGCAFLATQWTRIALQLEHALPRFELDDAPVDCVGFSDDESDDDVQVVSTHAGATSFDRLDPGDLWPFAETQKTATEFTTTTTT